MIITKITLQAILESNSWLDNSNRITSWEEVIGLVTLIDQKVIPELAPGTEGFYRKAGTSLKQAGILYLVLTSEGLDWGEIKKHL